MKTVLSLELIADNYIQGLRQFEAGNIKRHLTLRDELNMYRYGQKSLRPWVAKLTGLDRRGGFKREFVHWQTCDFSQANSIGSRGIYAYYTLDDGIYEINKRTSWTKARRYFVRVENTVIIEISRDEVVRCLANNS